MINVLMDGLFIDIDRWNEEDKIVFIVKSNYFNDLFTKWKTHGC